jgi:hypothetical protein
MPRVHRRTVLGSLALLSIGGGCTTTAPRPTTPDSPAPPRPPRPAAPGAPPERELRLKARGPEARGARALFEDIDHLGAADREQAIAAELLAGNVPSFLRKLVPLRLGDGARDAWVFATPDYVCVGSDDDFARMPITMRTTRKLCAAAGAMPPTKLLVDALYAAAPFKVTSPTMSPGSWRLADVVSHHEVIARRLTKAGGQPGDLVAGCKKDIVITRRMLEHGGRTALYGWMLKDQSVVQPLSLVHDDRFLDYVQGLRLIDRRLWIDGKDVDFLDALADRALAPLVSDEGAFDLRVAWARGW